MIPFRLVGLAALTGTLSFLLFKALGWIGVLALFLACLGYGVYYRVNSSHLGWGRAPAMLLGLVVGLAVAGGTHYPVHHKTVQKTAQGRVERVEGLRLDLDNPGKTLEELTDYLRLSPEEERELIKTKVALLDEGDQRLAQAIGGRKKYAKIYVQGTKTLAYWYMAFLCWPRIPFVVLTHHRSVWWAALTKGPAFAKAGIEREMYEEALLEYALRKNKYSFLPAQEKFGKWQKTKRFLTTCLNELDKPGAQAILAIMMVGPGGLKELLENERLSKNKEFMKLAKDASKLRLGWWIIVLVFSAWTIASFFLLFLITLLITVPVCALAGVVIASLVGAPISVGLNMAVPAGAILGFFFWRAVRKGKIRL